MVGWDSKREHSCGRAGQSPAVRRTSVLPSLNASSSPWGEPGQLLGASALMVYPKDRVALERQLLLILSQRSSLCLPETVNSCSKSPGSSCRNGGPQGAPDAIKPDELPRLCAASHSPSAWLWLAWPNRGGEDNGMVTQSAPPGLASYWAASWEHRSRHCQS